MLSIILVFFDRCLCCKIFINVRVLLFNIKIYELFELVCMDFFFIEWLKGGYEYILVIIDYFMKYVVVILIRNMMVKIIV